ncbi:MAG: hypothetical protein JO171_16325 [Paludibacterium sp.]|uniref:hypothetical protein n=1 Tax=Paludibacterium sp. TaxID=1917523 RepID=UPI0025F1F284|nr:hypothetical protein [Paludibacterium sp.]MBV8048716.1 hypothetical protein [Paludibacterium sp.]MBV8649007.1 hypothetical protein [Paludibacterium sp.]
MGLYSHLLNHDAPEQTAMVPQDAWARRQQLLLARYLAFTRPKGHGLLRWWRKR